MTAKKGKRIFFALLFGVALVLLLAVPVFAEGQAEIDDRRWKDFTNELPKEIVGFFGDFPENSSEFGKAVEKMSSAEYIASQLLAILGQKSTDALKLFCAICPLLIISAVFSAASSSMDNGSLNSAVRFCSSAVIFSTVIYTQYNHFGLIGDFFESVKTLMNAMIPMTASIWAMGGNVSTASVGSAAFYVELAVVEKLFGATVVPVCCIMSVLGLCDALSEEMKTARMLSAVKKIYNFFLVSVMTLLLSSLSAQTSITAAADGAAARTAKMLSGSVIPILGGSVGETLRTVAAGAAYLKNIFGVGGMLMIVMLLAPVAVSVLLTRLVFLLLGGVADVLGCSNEARMLDNLGEVHGCMLAVVSGVGVTFILSLRIFTETVIAVA